MLLEDARFFMYDALAINMKTFDSLRFAKERSDWCKKNPFSLAKGMCKVKVLDFLLSQSN